MTHFNYDIYITLPSDSNIGGIWEAELTLWKVPVFPAVDVRERGQVPQQRVSRRVGVAARGRQVHAQRAASSIAQERRHVVFHAKQ